MTSPLPHPPTVGRTLPARLLLSQIIRGLFLWVLVRTAAWVVVRVPATGGLSDGGDDVFVPAIIAAVSALAAVDARVMREPLFHASLGMPAWTPAVAAAGAALVLEVMLAVIR